MEALLEARIRLQKPLAAANRLPHAGMHAAWVDGKPEVAAGFAAAAASARTLLLDARPRAFYLGREKAPAARRPGTLPGALDFDNLRWFEPGSGALPDTATLERIAQDLPKPLDAAPANGVVSFCNTGHWAATNWFVLSQVLHRPHVALYPGSMVDWSRTDAPMAHVPTRWQQLRQQWERTWQAL